MLFNPPALFEALTLQAATAANVGDKSSTYTPMSDAIKAVKLPSDQQELLFEFLQHAKEDIPGWVPAGNYNGMDQYAKDIYYRISRILKPVSRACQVSRRIRTYEYCRVSDALFSEFAGSPPIRNTSLMLVT